MIRFRCKECGKKLKASEEIIGRKVECTRCESVETVPESDNLTKPKQPKIRLAANRPKPTQVKAAASLGGSKTANLDQPVELFGHSSSGSAPTKNFEPRFKVVTPKKSQLRRWVLFGLIALFAASATGVYMNLGWIMDVRRRFSTDYENLPEVVYYRNNVIKLEKSRRMMYIAGRNCFAVMGEADGERSELEEYNSSIHALTTKSGLIDEVETLFRSGKDTQARALLVKTARKLKSHLADVEQRTKTYIKLTQGR